VPFSSRTTRRSAFACHEAHRWSFYRIHGRRAKTLSGSRPGLPTVIGIVAPLSPKSRLSGQCGPDFLRCRRAGSRGAQKHIGRYEAVFNVVQTVIPGRRSCPKAAARRRRASQKPSMQSDVSASCPFSHNWISNSMPAERQLVAVSCDRHRALVVPRCRRGRPLLKSRSPCRFWKEKSTPL
jgi:hypothetical protein